MIEGFPRTEKNWYWYPLRAVAAPADLYRFSTAWVSPAGTLLFIGSFSLTQILRERSLWARGTRQLELNDRGAADPPEATGDAVRVAFQGV